MIMKANLKKVNQQLLICFPSYVTIIIRAERRYIVAVFK